MDTNEFLRLIRQHANTLNLSFYVEKNRGKGSHRMVYVGAKRSTVPWKKGRSIPLGTRRRILEVLGLNARMLW